MVHLLRCRSSSVHTLLLLSSILLLVTSSMEFAFSDAKRLPLPVPEDTGGGIDKAVAADDKQEAAAVAARSSRGEETTGGRERRRALIGSRPPRCERVCLSCGHCEAVQVPIVPQEEEKARAADVVTVAAAMFTYRVDGISNYKPLSWKCRCGGTILDP